MDRDNQTDHGGYEQTRGRGRLNRRNATDIGSTYVHWMQNRRPNARGRYGFEVERPHASYIADMLPPAARKGHAVDTVPAKLLHTSFNKVKHSINVVQWTPEGRRLLTGSGSGEFTLWNGTGFNFETIMQAHDVAVHALQYSHNDEWLVSADKDGVIKYWQPNFNNVKEIKAHTGVIRGLAFAPTDAKFVSASEDQTMKIFDFASSVEEVTLTGHQWDVKSVDWHPSKGLLVSGSRDYTVKLWDPRTGRCLTTLHGHKNTVNATKFEPTRGVLLASCAKDSTTRIFDIRMMRDVFLLKGHEKDVNSLTWHPIHSSLLSTGSADGAINHYLLDEQHAPAGIPNTTSPYDSPNPSEAPAQTIYPAHKVSFAHEYNIWSMDWHPLGHILASGANDRATRFWTRPRPGEDSFHSDRWHIGQKAAEERGTWKKSEAQRAHDEEEAAAEEEADGLEDQRMPIRQSFLPGLPALPGLAAASNPNFPIQPPYPIPPGGVPDMAALAQAYGGTLPPFPPPMANGAPPPDFPMPLPAGFVPPPGFPPLPPGGFPGMGGQAQMMQAAMGGGGGIRKRAPLPDQSDALREEMRQGRFTKAR